MVWGGIPSPPTHGSSPMEQAGLKVGGKELFCKITDWTPALIAEKLGTTMPAQARRVGALNRPALNAAKCLPR